MFGVLNIHKPPDVTSRDVVNVVQRAIRPIKTGHAGTLDPMATGVLLVCVGKATKLISLLQQSPKVYEADFILGQTSDTDDSTGTILQIDGDSSRPTEGQVRDTAGRFVGKIEQVPPAYSAVKVAGRRAYTKARRGEEFTLAAKQVVVHDLEVTHFSWPQLTVRITCGSGTYIRSIARDLGKELGCGGLMSRLVRTRIGSFDLNKAVTPEQITQDGVAAHLVDPIGIVDRLPRYKCTDSDQQLISSGRRIPFCPAQLVSSPPNADADQPTALVSEGGESLLALAELQLENGTIQPRTVFC